MQCGCTIGVDERQLLLQAMGHIYGMAHPLTVSARQADQQLALKTLHGGIMRRHFAGEANE